LGRRLGGPQSWFGCYGEEKNSQPLPGPETTIIHPIAQSYSAELSRLLSTCMMMYNVKYYNFFVIYMISESRSNFCRARSDYIYRVFVAGKVKLSLYLTKYCDVKMYPLFNQPSDHEILGE
jgi:hypothetical protein